MESMAHNIVMRKSRFKRKFYSNNWNYFITVTYDDIKHTEESFCTRLSRCLSNFHTRCGWLYMGIFERSSNTNRLHFHALLYVPDGQMNGVTDDFFTKRFGRSEIKSMFETDMRKDILLSFFMQYIGKSNERVIYSRGILEKGQ